MLKARLKRLAFAVRTGTLRDANLGGSEIVPQQAKDRPSNRRPLSDARELTARKSSCRGARGELPIVSASHTIVVANEGGHCMVSRGVVASRAERQRARSAAAPEPLRERP